MRVNIYAEEMTDRVEIVSKNIDGEIYTGIRFYLYLPTTVPRGIEDGCMGMQEIGPHNVKGPFIHRHGDDDSSAVTFWGKKDLRAVLVKAIELLDERRNA